MRPPSSFGHLRYCTRINQQPTTLNSSTYKAKFLFVLINEVEGAKCSRDLWRRKGNNVLEISVNFFFLAWLCKAAIWPVRSESVRGKDKPTCLKTTFYN